MRWVNRKNIPDAQPVLIKGKRGKSYFAPCRKQWKSGLRWVEGITETKELNWPAYEGLWRSEREIYTSICSVYQMGNIFSYKPQNSEYIFLSK